MDVFRLCMGYLVPSWSPLILDENPWHRFLQDRRLKVHKEIQSTETRLHPFLIHYQTGLLREGSVAFLINMPIKWRNRQSVGLAINRSWVQFRIGAKLRNNLGQVVHTYMPMSPSSITWYWPRDGDALQLGK